MADLDAELLDRVVRWCAEAGRHAGDAEIRRALEPLGWDELLAVRALLADPPPARPLGPYALADLARGAPADVCAERERGGRYPSAAAPAEARAPESARTAASPRAAPAPARGRRRGAAVVIRRARDVSIAGPPPAPAAPLLDELLLPQGRTVLERLVRRHGARRPALVAALAAGWRTPSGRAPDDSDLSRLIEDHGLARAFARRERDELLHALRAAGGVKASAAQRLGTDLAALDAALARLGATAAAERIRDERRSELRARGTLADRVRLLLTEAPRLEDLGLVAELEGDLRRRLPDHLRALREGGAPLVLALSRSLSITPADAKALVERFGLSLDAPRDARPPPRPGAAPRRSPPPGASRRPRGEAAPRRPDRDRVVVRPGRSAAGERPRPAAARRPPGGRAGGPAGRGPRAGEPRGGGRRPPPRGPRRG